MVSWIVLLKTAEGTQTIPVEADFVQSSDDRRDLTFSDVGPVVDALKAFESVKDDTPQEEAIAAFRAFIRALSKISVASFKSEAVIGYYQVAEPTATE